LGLRKDVLTQDHRVSCRRPLAPTYQPPQRHVSDTRSTRGERSSTKYSREGREGAFHIYLEYYCYTDRSIQFKPMRMGDPPKYPLPKIDGDPFVLLLESQLKRDSGRCEAWKDEVNNLLIFVSLDFAPRPKADTIFVRRPVFSLQSSPRSSSNRTKG